jgi:hypothetical protein
VGSAETQTSRQTHQNACSSNLNRRWHRRDGIVRFEKQHFTSSLYLCHQLESTITYDILVRAGVDTTSAFVPNLLSASGAESGFDPLAAKGSRGIYIIPDICFEFSICGPVGLLVCSLKMVLLILSWHFEG